MNKRERAELAHAAQLVKRALKWLQSDETAVCCQSSFPSTSLHFQIPQRENHWLTMNVTVGSPVQYLECAVQVLERAERGVVIESA